MKLVELFEGTLFDCQMIKNLLENGGIGSTLKDEIIGTRGGGIMPRGGVKVIVPDTDLEKAKNIVDGFINSRKEE